MKKTENQPNNEMNEIEQLKAKIAELENKLKNDEKTLWQLYSILENLNLNDKYLKDVSQEEIAKSDMIKWLFYPTELGSMPDKIELLGEIIYNDTRCFAYKFSKEDFKIKGEMIGVAGGYPIDKISSRSSGHTFSKFELVSDDWKKQAYEILELISEHWKNYAKENG